MPRTRGSPPAASTMRDEPRAVGVRDAGRAQSRPGRPHLVAGREDPDDRPAMDVELVDARRPAARPIAAGVRTVPASRIRVPAARSLPARRMEPPTGTAAWTRTPAGSGPVASRPRGPAGVPSASRGVVPSTGTTASAPGGTGAPVAMRTARAAPDRDVGRLAGADLADDLEPERGVLGRRRRRRRPGWRSRPSRSCPRAAARSGSSTGSATTRPRASISQATSAGVGPAIAANTARRASSTLSSRSALTRPGHLRSAARSRPASAMALATARRVTIPVSGAGLEDRQPVQAAAVEIARARRAATSRARRSAGRRR